MVIQNPHMSSHVISRSGSLMSSMSIRCNYSDHGHISITHKIKRLSSGNDFNKAIGLPVPSILSNVRHTRQVYQFSAIDGGRFRKVVGVYRTCEERWSDQYW